MEGKQRVGTCCRRRRWATYVQVHGGRAHCVDVEFEDIPPQPANTTRLVCVSDTHQHMGWVDVPPGDVLLHAGDIAFNGGCGAWTYRCFNRAMAALPHAHKIVIAGNHDIHLAEAGAAEAARLMPAVTYLQDQECIVPLPRPLRVYGTPVTLAGASVNRAFQDRHNAGLSSAFARIPHGLDVLLTHQPVRHCATLEREVRRARPAVHVAGHYHGYHGARYDASSGTLHIIACISGNGGWNWPSRTPLVYDLPHT